MNIVSGHTNWEDQVGKNKFRAGTENGVAITNGITKNSCSVVSMTVKEG